MNNQVSGVYVGSKIPQILRDGIDKAIEKGNYLNCSDFIRDAVKEKLHREGITGSRASTEENSLEA
jgi:Arc/MetJ-type ribon-helix-helix transcriptional regulator